MHREEGLAILESQGWLSKTPVEFRRAFLSAAQWHRFEKGATVTLGGEEKDDGIGLAQGTVAATSTLGPAGTPMMHLASAVFWMGYGPLLLERPRDVTVEARTDIQVAVFSKAKILPLLDGTTQWWRCFMLLLAEYGDTCATIASELLIRNSDQRLAATILRFAGPSTDKALRVPATQAELADATNLSRNAAGAILRRLAEKGFIRIDYGGIALLDRVGLQRFVVNDSH